MVRMMTCQRESTRATNMIFIRKLCLGGSSGSGSIGWKCDGKRYAAHTEVWGIPETMVS